MADTKTITIRLLHVASNGGERQARDARLIEEIKDKIETMLAQPKYVHLRAEVEADS